MGFIVCLILAVSGALVGGIAGGLVTGYWVIFKSMAHIASMADPAQWTKLFEGVIILLFTKSIIIAGAVAGGFFCAIPGMLGMAKYSEDD